MKIDAIMSYITSTFSSIDIVDQEGNYFFFYHPDPERPADHTLPFMTLVTNDAYDPASNLDRPDVFRLNIGIHHDSYQALFGPNPSFPKDAGVVDTGHDFTVLDQLMPHPVYAAMSWVCVLNPSDRTFETLKPLMAEAYELVVRRYTARATRHQA